jgi:hypothetical protein
LFDNGRPLQIDVGCRILEVLQATTDGAASVPRYKLVDAVIELGPDLLPSRQGVEFQILTSGRPSRPTIKSYLIDTKVDYASAIGLTDRLLGQKSVELWTAAGGISSVLALLLAAVIFFL